MEKLRKIFEKREKTKVEKIRNLFHRGRERRKRMLAHAEKGEKKNKKVF